MERRRGATVATFFAELSFAANNSITLPDEAAQHVRVRRMQPGEALRLTNGRGSVALAVLERVTKHEAVVSIRDVSDVVPAPALRLFAPVADRDRMLWLAEKSVEVGISTWQPVLFHRSGSVSPRGEGEKFRQKVRARMIGALEQSGGAWLPAIEPELPLRDALVRAESSAGERLFLDREGGALVDRRPIAADVMIGPEGGVEDEERVLIVEECGWLPVSLGDTTLRFETAGVIAAAVVRMLLAKSSTARRNGG